MTARFFEKNSLPEVVSSLTKKYESVNWDGPLGGFFTNDENPIDSRIDDLEERLEDQNGS